MKAVMAGSGNYFHNFKKMKGKCIPVGEKRYLFISDFLSEVPQQPPSLHMFISNPGIGKNRLGRSFRSKTNIGRASPAKTTERTEWENMLMLT